LRSDPIKVDRLLLNGDLIEAGNSKLYIMHTPGHTPGSITIITAIDGKVVGFCGDSVGGLHSSINRSSAIDFQKTIDKLMNYPFDVLIFGHGNTRFWGKEQYQPILKMAKEATEKKRKQQSKDEKYQELFRWW